jgi:hypothetical protein
MQQSLEINVLLVVQLQQPLHGQLVRILKHVKERQTLLIMALL